MEIRPMEWTDYQKVYALWLLTSPNSPRKRSAGCWAFAPDEKSGGCILRLFRFRNLTGWGVFSPSFLLR